MSPIKLLSTVSKSLTLVTFSLSLAGLSSVSANTVIWAGNGVDANWLTDGNWVGVSTPAANDVLSFGLTVGSIGTSTTNNFTAGTQFNGLLFDGANAYTLAGNSINLGGNVISTSSVTQTANFDINLLQATTFNTSSGLTLGGAISGGSNSLTKDGAGTLTLNGANAYTGNTIIKQGTLALGATGDLSPSSSLVIGGIDTAGSRAAFTASGVGGTSDTLNGVTFAAGRSQITTSRSSGTGSYTLNLGALTRAAVGMANFTANANSLITTSASNTNGILGGWATVGTNWATVSGGNIIAYSAYTATGGTATNQIIDSGAANNVQLNAGGDISVVGDVTYNTNVITVTDTTGLVVGDSVSGGWAATAGAGQLRTTGGTYITAIDTNTNQVTLSRPISRGWSGSQSGTAANGVTIAFHHAVALGSTITDVNTLQYTDAANRTVNIGALETLRLGATGAIWKNNAASTSAGMGSSIIFNGGTITAGGADNTAGELIIRSEGATDAFSSGNASRNNIGVLINSDIKNNGTGVVTLVNDTTQTTQLGGNNTYTGGTYITRGRVIAASATAIGSGDVYLFADPSASLFDGQLTTFAGATYAQNFHTAGKGGLVLGASTIINGSIELLGDTSVTTSGATSTTMGVLAGEIIGSYGMYLGTSNTNLLVSHTNNSWTGFTTVATAGSSGSNSTLVRLGANQALGSGDLTLLDGASNANPTVTVDLNGFNQTVGALVSQSTTVIPQAASRFLVQSSVGTGVLTVGNNNKSGDYYGTLQNGGGTLSLIKTGTGTQTLSGVSTYTGQTTVNDGVLLVSGTMTGTSGVVVNGGLFKYTNDLALDRDVTVGAGGAFGYSSIAAYTGTLVFNGGATLSGTNWGGSFSGLTIGSGSSIAPGNSPGQAFGINQTWADGGHYEFEINDADGSLGVNWDNVSFSGDLDISGLTAGGFTIDLISLTSLNEAGLLANFDDTMDYSWEIANFASITGSFVADRFAINDAGFENSYQGSFNVGQVGNTIVLNYSSAVPEPSTYSLLFSVLVMLFVVRRRRLA